MDSMTHRTYKVPLNALALRKLAGQEIAQVTGNRFWQGRVPGDRATLERVLSLPSRLDKWKGVWLLLSRPSTLKFAIQQHAMDKNRNVTAALLDATWSWHYCGNSDWPELQQLAEWLRHERLLDPGVVRWLDEHPEPHPSSDAHRLEKSLVLLGSALRAASEGQRHWRWGTGHFDLRPLRPKTR